MAFQGLALSEHVVGAREATAGKKNAFTFTRRHNCSSMWFLIVLRMAAFIFLTNLGLPNAAVVLVFCRFYWMQLSLIHCFITQRRYITFSSKLSTNKEKDCFPCPSVFFSSDSTAPTDVFNPSVFVRMEQTNATLNFQQDTWTCQSGGNLIRWDLRGKTTWIQRNVLCQFEALQKHYSLEQ